MDDFIQENMEKIRNFIGNIQFTGIKNNLDTSATKLKICKEDVDYEKIFKEESREKNNKKVGRSQIENWEGL